MCKVNSQMIVADGAAVGQALNNIANALEASEPAIATDLKSAASALIAATSSWTEGTPLNAVEDAENAAIAVLNVIPTTSPLAPLVAIAFAALNLLIANGQTQAVQTPTASLSNVKALLSAADTVHPQSPWAGKAEIKHTGDLRKNFAQAFNEKAIPLGVEPVTV
jgi:hypothetical protein